MNKMDFYTIVLRRSGDYWVVLCLENGIVGQGDTKDDAIKKTGSYLVFRQTNSR